MNRKGKYLRDAPEKREEKGAQTTTGSFRELHTKQQTNNNDERN